MWSSCCWFIKHWLVLISCYVLKHPDFWGRQVLVCSQSLDSELNTEEQSSVVLNHRSGTNSQKTAGRLETEDLSVVLRFRTALWLLSFSLVSFKPSDVAHFPISSLVSMCYNMISMPLWSTLSCLVSDWITFQAKCRGADWVSNNSLAVRVVTIVLFAPLRRLRDLHSLMQRYWYGYPASGSTVIISTC